MRTNSQTRTPLDLCTSVATSPNVLVQEMDGEAVLLNLESERYFGLDDVGTRIWQLLQSHRRLDRVCAEMQKEFDVDADTIRADVRRLVGELIDAGVITTEPVVEDDPSNT